MELKVNEAKDFLTKKISAFLKDPKFNTPIMLWGPPGIGKSAIVHQAADSLGIDLIDLRLQLCEPEDLKGFPYPDKTKNIAVWFRPEDIPAEGTGILFLDELNTAHKQTQNAALQLIYDRRVGKHKLGDGWFIIAAGNRKEDFAHITKLSSAMISRLIHLKVTPDFDDWLKWAVNNIRAEIIAFLKLRPMYFADYSTLKIDPELPYPCPRTWEFLNRDFDIVSENSTFDKLCSAYVGPKAGTEFAIFVKNNFNKYVPLIEKILKGEKIEIPKDFEALVILVTASTQRAHTPTQVRNVTKFLYDVGEVEINKKKLEELKVLGYKFLVQKPKELQEVFIETPEWKKDWKKVMEKII